MPAITLSANAHDHALTFVIRHAAQHLDGTDLVRRTAEHLRDEHDISEATAFEVAAWAWAEYDGRNSRDYIDVTRTTGRCLLMQLEDGRTLAFTVRHLLRAAELLAESGEPLPGKCPKQEPRAALVP